MKTLYVWRHGQTDYNIERRLQGCCDTPLNDNGKFQADKAAQVLAERGVTHVISSPLARAVDTAQALASLVGVEVQVLDGLIERSYGQWEGLTAAQIEADAPEQYAQWRQTGECPEVGIELCGETGRRVAACLQEFMDGVDEDAVVVAVSHGSAINAGITQFLGLDAQVWHGLKGLNNAHVGHIRQARKAPGWYVESWNENVGSVS
ncbi:histidine phosphatase family protein [Actinomyces vulturis]|uniref:histidine phosphatase family protein n=1 Tax=Actinomyces vulturis TaxID=1857645 RepID=UPI0008299953|nr:histidine phosphatase family protein [Actinomyces vulturis]